MSTAALRAEVCGRAGLGEAVVGRARALGLAGWVREDRDGVVRVHAEGDAEAVVELRAFLGAGVTEQPAKVEGHEQFAVRGVPAGAFVVREHAGGFDLCLEVGDRIVAWRLRRGPSMDPAVRRMAIETSAPDLAAEATVWDGGAYEQGGRVPWPEALRRGHAVFVLHGERLRGGFALQRTRGEGSGSQWLLVKRRDEAASTAP
jgi:acylphosphatase